eukprot:3339887-Amphidinium_carterae.2
MRVRASHVGNCFDLGISIVLLAKARDCANYHILFCNTLVSVSATRAKECAFGVLHFCFNHEAAVHRASASWRPALTASTLLVYQTLGPEPTTILREHRSMQPGHQPQKKPPLPFLLHFNQYEKKLRPHVYAYQLAV